MYKTPFICLSSFSEVKSGALMGTGGDGSSNDKLAYILAAAGVLLILLILIVVYLICKRKDTLAMELLLKNRAAMVENAYANSGMEMEDAIQVDPTRERVLFASNRLSNDSHASRESGFSQTLSVHSDRWQSRESQTQVHNLLYATPQCFHSHPHTPSRVSTTSAEVGRFRFPSTGSEPANLMRMRKNPYPSRPATYASIDGGAYEVTPSRGVQTLDGFQVGESNDYDSLPSDGESPCSELQTQDEPPYENKSTPAPPIPKRLRSVYLHPPHEDSNAPCVPPPVEKPETKRVKSGKDSAIHNVHNPAKEPSSHVDKNKRTDDPNESAVPDPKSDASDNEHEYSSVSDAETDPYYEDGTSVVVANPQDGDSDSDGYDYVGGSSTTLSTVESPKVLPTPPPRQASVEDFSGPTTYYDDIRLFAARDDNESATDEEPIYEETDDPQAIAKHDTENSRNEPRTTPNDRFPDGGACNDDTSMKANQEKDDDLDDYDYVSNTTSPPQSPLKKEAPSKEGFNTPEKRPETTNQHQPEFPKPSREPPELPGRNRKSLLVFKPRKKLPDLPPERQPSVEEEFTGPTTYYDDIRLLAVRGNRSKGSDESDGDLPEYEPVRHTGSGLSETSARNDPERASIASYESIGSKEHDYDDIDSDTDGNKVTSPERESDYESLPDTSDAKKDNDVEVGPDENEDNNKKTDTSVIPDVIYDVPVASKEPVYDDVCDSEP